jgi:hypothetical protein
MSTYPCSKAALLLHLAAQYKCEEYGSDSETLDILLKMSGLENSAFKGQHTKSCFVQDIKTLLKYVCCQKIFTYSQTRTRKFKLECQRTANHGKNK